MANDEAANAPSGTEGGAPPEEGSPGGGYGNLIGRLDAARAALEEAAEVLADFGEEDAHYDARSAFHTAGEVAGIIEEHEEAPGSAERPASARCGGDGETKED